MWYVYGLQGVNGHLYIGSTNDLKRRLGEHNGQRGELKFYVAVNTAKTARSLEKYFKTGSGKAIIKKRILTDKALA